MKHLTALFLGILLLVSCKKTQPDLRNLDCGCAKETTAEFDIEDIWGYGYSWEQRSITDSTFNEINIGFTAKADNATYKWYIGNEILYTKSVVRYFSSDFIGQTIPITLVVHKKPNHICFPTDDGYDSITKRVVITNRNFDSAFQQPNPTLEGVYRMKEENSSDSVEIIFDLYYDMSGPRVTISNYDGNGSILQGSSSNNFVRLYRQMWWDQNKFYLMLYNKPNGEAILTLDPKPLAEAPTYHYKGRKIQ